MTTRRRVARQNPFEEAAVAGGYEGWFETPAGKAIDLEETALIRSMVPRGEGETFLDVGCGTGHFSRVMAENDYLIFGLDISIAMLKEAVERGRGRYILGDAEVLPHRNRAFTASGAFTILEFVDDPSLAVEEMIRVSRSLVVVAFLSKWGGINLRRRIRNLFGKRDLYSDARFFSVREMVGIVKRAAQSQERECDINWGSAVGPQILKRLFSRSGLDSFILFTIHLSDRGG